MAYSKKSYLHLSHKGTFFWDTLYDVFVTTQTSYFGPADMTGQDCSVQNSVIVPYNILIWLKKSTVLTATHSLRSSPSGNITANLRFPDLKNRDKTSTKGSSSKGFTKNFGKILGKFSEKNAQMMLFG